MAPHPGRTSNSQDWRLGSPLGGHLNPAIEGHFKTGQRRTRISGPQVALLRATRSALDVAVNPKKNKGDREEIAGAEGLLKR